MRAEIEKIMHEETGKLQLSCEFIEQELKQVEKLEHEIEHLKLELKHKEEIIAIYDRCSNK